MDVCVCVSVYVCAKSLQSCSTLPARLLCPWGFSTQEYWSGLPCPPSRDPLDPGIKSEFLISPALAGGFFTTSAPWEAWNIDGAQHIFVN